MLQVRLMKTEAMRRVVGIDKTGSESSKAMKIAKTVGHGVESVSYQHIRRRFCYLYLTSRRRWFIVFQSHLLGVSSAS